MQRITIIAVAILMLLTGMHSQAHAETLAQDQRDLLRLQIEQAELQQRLMREYVRCIQATTQGIIAYYPQHDPATETADDYCRRQALIHAQ